MTRRAVLGGALDRRAVLSQGKLEQYGTPEEIYRHPATPFVAAFVGESNVFHGAVAGDASSPAVRIADVVMPVADARGHSIGERVRVLTRPESTFLDVPSDNTLGVPATVVSQQFQGARTRVLAHLDHVEDPTAVILCDVTGTGHGHLVAGAQVLVRFDPNAALVATVDDLAGAQAPE